jgi:hypothetical protein
MRGRLCGLLVAGMVLAVVTPAGGDEQAEGLKLVGKAIQAAGGAAKLAKFKAATLKGKGNANAEGMDVPFSFDITASGSDKLKLDLEASINGQQMKIQVILNGDKAWLKHGGGGEVQDAPAEVLDLIKAEIYALRAVQQLVSLKDKAVKLAPLGEVKVGDKPALGVKVTRKDHPDMDLFFDKENGLPVKVELRVKEPEQQEVVHEWIFSDHKETGGLKQPTKVTLNRDGKKFREVELSEVKAEEKVDDSTFAKP